MVKNVSTNDLYNWNAVVETMDLYEKYLLFPNADYGNEPYCNCTSEIWFGEGEAPEMCSELEMNECNKETEFRCKSGMCIPLSSAYDGTDDCLDRSDEQRDDTGCFYDPSAKCEEYNCVG
ncbi:unnamed protein product [Didymodactylos carnosus]|uniref:Uncharacterized protein n=1 Tax=Didymodactylos carnosus TaxID=1234261 RepID=A0A815H559_9BILA|nr:unnamed protein product [Didymodactylos carnosus]CAF1349384.1 unnamed protein product [Didymodactylos carnosus]CAF4108252.1 unnamed protein product [Didymodactylos carnosus]CAF4217996.1 unnamed protein product [Didymodactylos carnosus]